MLRHDMDQWDIASSVGLTALGVAGGRAIESQRPDALINDPYAEALVEAAESGIPTPTSPAGVAQQQDPDFARVWSHASTHMGIRTRFFDEFFQNACNDGATQAVILASGLDARAYRLDWPTGFAVFEIDQPQVLQFKHHVLTREGAQPRCTHRAVPIDLRADWPAALEQAGFDRNRPTAWLAEGLLPYLPDDAEQSLLTAVHQLSAPGSRIAIEHLKSINTFADDNDTFQRVSRQFGVDVRELIYDNADRPDPDSRLHDWGWTTNSALGSELAHRYGRDTDQHDSEELLNIAEHGRYITAQLRR